MPTSEIDDIFASKRRPPPSAPPKASSSSLPPPHNNNKKTKKAKTKDSEDKPLKRKREEAVGAPNLTKREVPETVFDPSAALPSAKQNRAAREEKSAVSVAKYKKQKKAREEEVRFKDSRGTGPRRKTDEGFAIYKEDELGITDQGGDTPLCPFDCQCCF